MSKLRSLFEKKNTELERGARLFFFLRRGTFPSILEPAGYYCGRLRETVGYYS